MAASRSCHLRKHFRLSGSQSLQPGHQFLPHSRGRTCHRRSARPGARLRRFGSLARCRPIYTPQPTGASVNQLVLINRSKRPLLLLAGELVSGGKQDRVIGKDRIVPVGAPPLPLDVFCVEHGRWTGSSQFAAANTIVHPSVRESAAVDQVQTKVWESVRNGTNAKAKPAAPPAKISSENLSAAIAGNGRTEAYEKIYESRASAYPSMISSTKCSAVSCKPLQVLKNERVVGVVVAYGGDVAWSDIFASSDLFDHYWRKLLRSYAVEALTRPSYRKLLRAENANEFLRRLNGRETQENRARRLPLARNQGRSARPNRARRSPT